MIVTDQTVAEPSIKSDSFKETKKHIAFTLVVFIVVVLSYLGSRESFQ